MLRRGDLLYEYYDPLTDTELRSTETKDLPPHDGDAGERNKPKQYVVAWVHPEGDIVSLVHVDASRGRTPVNRSLTDVLEAIREGDWTAARVETPEHTLIPIDDDHAKHHQIKAARWDAIKDLVHPHPDPRLFDPSTRGRLVAAHAAKVAKTRDQLYSFLHTFWVNGQDEDALLPPYNRCGAPGVARFAEPHAEKGPGRPREPYLFHDVPTPPTYRMQKEDRDHVRKAINRWRKRKTDQSLRSTFDDMLSRHYVSHFLHSGGEIVPVLKPPGQRPTFKQFDYYAKKEMSEDEWRRARSGEQRYAASIAGNQGRATRRSSGAGAVYTTDATQSDVHAISSIDPSSRVGRPTIYLVIDLFTLLITGLYVGFENPSWVAARLALYHAFDGMASTLKAVGLEDLGRYFPGRGVCGHVLVDKGAEFNGHKANGLIEGWGPTWKNCRSRSPRQRATGELFFHVLNKLLFQALPGGIVPKNMQRGRMDPRLDACLTAPQIRAAAIRAAAHINRTLPSAKYLTRTERANGVGPTPIERWEYSIRHMTGHLKTPTSQELHVHLLATEKLKVTADGIIHGHLRFTGPRARREAWTTEAKNGGIFYLDGRVDPSLPQWIWVRRQGETGGFDMCTLLQDNSEYAECYFEDIELVHERDEEAEKLREDDRTRSSVALGARVKSMSNEAEAVRKVANAGIPRKEQVSNIKENQRMEREIERDERRMETAKRFGGVAPAPRHTEPPGIDEDGDEDADYFARVRRARKENAA